jgi:hypothetical protein
MKRDLYGVLILIMLGCLIYTTSRTEPEASKRSIGIQGWHFEEPPENVSIVGAWEREGFPGSYDYQGVVHAGELWLADLPDGKPSVNVAMSAPVAWQYAP